MGRMKGILEKAAEQHRKLKDLEAGSLIIDNEESNMGIDPVYTELIYSLPAGKSDAPRPGPIYSTLIGSWIDPKTGQPCRDDGSPKKVLDENGWRMD